MEDNVGMCCCFFRGSPGTEHQRDPSVLQCPEGDQVQVGYQLLSASGDVTELIFLHKSL